MSALTVSESVAVADSFLLTLYGDALYAEWKDVKRMLSFYTERDYVAYLLELARQHNQTMEDAGKGEDADLVWEDRDDDMSLPPAVTDNGVEVSIEWSSPPSSPQHLGKSEGDCVSRKRGRQRRRSLQAQVAAAGEALAEWQHVVSGVGTNEEGMSDGQPRQSVDTQLQMLTNDYTDVDGVMEAAAFLIKGEPAAARLCGEAGSSEMSTPPGSAAGAEISEFIREDHSSAAEVAAVAAAEQADEPQLHCCPHCRYRSAYKSNVRKHTAAVHRREVRFTCPHCGGGGGGDTGYSTFYKHHYLKHMRSKHPHHTH